MPDAPAPTKHISMDAMLVAGASLLGVFLLMRSNSANAAAAGLQPTSAAPVDASALEQGILSDPAFWATLSQQQAFMSPPPAAPSPAPTDSTSQPASSMPMPQPKPAAPDPTSLPHINADLFPHALPASAGLAVIGAITGAGGQYSGLNVAGGVPVYAETGGQWVQGFNAKGLPVGTPIATLSSFHQYEVPGQVTENI
ncbi:MAG TPA: hypothetical protein VFC09_09785 [Candidatus Dormibacteraeota bacterium]|nr:hypothetical protein [Candidatus Dormibacteraeota bacterium]